jgi:flagellar hook-associated protein 2
MAITLSGFNNIDFKSIVDILIKAERQPIERIEAQQKAEQARLTAYGNLTSALSKLQTAFTALKPASAYGDLKALSSDATVLSATASSSASKGSFSINVTSLARAQVTASAARQFNDINAAVIDGGTFSITQNGTTTNVDLTNVTTLAQLRDAINATQTGVKASIVNDGSTADSPAKPFRLVLSSTTPGLANAFTVDDQTSYQGGSAGTILNLSTDATNGVALDSVFTYNGIQIQSASTTVSDAVPGVTLKLLKAGTSIVTIDSDDSSLETKVEEVVDAFNAFNDFVQTQFKLPANGSARAPLATDPLLRGLNRQIRTYFTADHSNSGDIHNVSSIGLRLTQTGKLEIDKTALAAALSGDPDGVQAFLSDTSGFAAKVSDYIDSLTASDGTIESTESRIQLNLDSYARRIASLESQLALREEALTRQFAAADKAISQMNSQANALTSLGNQYRLF